MRRSIATGRRWAVRAPSGAVSTLPATMPSRAGPYTKPSDSGGRPGTLEPLNT